MASWQGSLARFVFPVSCHGRVAGIGSQHVPQFMSAPLPSPLSAAAAAIPLEGPHGPMGVLVCGHGSRNRLAVAEFADLARQLRGHLGAVPLEYGYLEFARPILRDGLERLRQRGVRHVLAIPAMLFAAGHAKNDIPSVLNAYAAETGLRIDYGRELGVDRSMILAAGARIRACLEQANAEDLAAGRAPIPLHDTVLVVVGRGSSDPDANSNVAKVTRMLVEGFGFGWGETCYSGVTFPLVEPGLRQIVRLGYRRLVVFPYFLFSGVLVSRIVDHSQRVAADHPAIDFRSASYLGDHAGVLDTFRERVLDVLRGDTAMNCSLCKYRAQVLGFEQEVGLPQQSHHHHVEGLIESCNLCERECTGACQPDGVPLPLSPSHAHSHSNGNGHPHTHDHGHSPCHDSGPAQDHSHAGEHGPSNEHGHGQEQGHSHGEVHSHGHAHAPGPGSGHDHPPHDHRHGVDDASPSHQHHHPYPHADHPLGPRTLRSRAGLKPSASGAASAPTSDGNPAMGHEATPSTSASPPVPADAPVHTPLPDVPNAPTDGLTGVEPIAAEAPPPIGVPPGGAAVPAERRKLKKFV
jgi:sirohydrochlorin cobaltochelatase